MRDPARGARARARPRDGPVRRRSTSPSTPSTCARCRWPTLADATEPARAAALALGGDARPARCSRRSSPSACSARCRPRCSSARASTRRWPATASSSRPSASCSRETGAPVVALVAAGRHRRSSCCSQRAASISSCVHDVRDRRLLDARGGGRLRPARPAARRAAPFRVPGLSAGAGALRGGQRVDALERADLRRQQALGGAHGIWRSSPRAFRRTPLFRWRRARAKETAR